MTNAETVDLCEKLGVPVRSHSSSLQEAYADMVRRRAERDGLTRAEQPDEPASGSRPRSRPRKRRPRRHRPRRRPPGRQRPRRRLRPRSATANDGGPATADWTPDGVEAQRRPPQSTRRSSARARARRAAERTPPQPTPVAEPRRSPSPTPSPRWSSRARGTPAERTTSPGPGASPPGRVPAVVSQRASRSRAVAPIRSSHGPRRHRPHVPTSPPRPLRPATPLRRPRVAAGLADPAASRTSRVGQRKGRSRHPPARRAPRPGRAAPAVPVVPVVAPVGMPDGRWR